MVEQAAIRRSLDDHRDDLPFPDAIAGWDIQVRRDATGDDAVWVWVVLHDDRVDQVWPLETRNELRDRVRELVRDRAAPAELQVYVRFRSESEQKGIAGEAGPG